MTEVLESPTLGAVRSLLHVGCGPVTVAELPLGFRSGWTEVRFDIDTAAKPDIVGTITDMEAVRAASMDALYSSHNIEHVHSYQVLSVLKEFRRVLKDDGFAVITCPDLQSLGEAISAGRIAEPLYVSAGGPITVLDILYGHGAPISRGKEYMAHHTGFTAPLLGELCRAAGFATVASGRRTRFFDLWAVASCAKRDDDALKSLFRDYTFCTL